MALTQEQINHFQARGYLPYEKVIEDDWLATLRQAYDHEMSRGPEGGSFRSPAETPNDNGGTATQQRMLQIMNMCERSLAFRRLIHHEPILDAVEDLIGPNIMLFHDQALFKPAFEGGPIFWHQDNAYWKCRPANLVSCWLTLDDVDRDNGAMQILPCSHLQPHLHDRSEQSGALLKTKLEIDEAQVVSVDLPAGACMFHHCQTLHCTHPNATDRQRRAFAIHFMPFGTRDANGEIMHASFTRPVLRMRS